MSATFLGLLLVQGFGRAHGEELGPNGAATAGTSGVGNGLPGAAAGGEGLAADGSTWGAIQPAIAAGSVLEVGAVIDPAALTKLSGDVRFADGLDPGGAAARAAAEAALVAGPVPAEAGAPAEIAMAGAVVPPASESPEIPSENAEGEPLGDIGTVDTGGSGDDTLIGTDRDDRLDGGAGDDLILGGAGDDSLSGRAGDDTILGEAGDDSIDGGTGSDSLFGGAGDDGILGGDGDDRVFGGAGDDDLDGGPGDDLVDGGTGIDEMTGGTGRDRLVVDHPHDLALEHSAGADGGGIDTLEIGAGFAANLRSIQPDAAPAGLTTFVLGNETIGALPEGAEAYATRVQPNIENVRLGGSDAHDVMGDGRDNRLVGNEGDNRLYGGAGDDWLEGGAGDDWLEGGPGADLLYGAEGDDVFLLGLSDSAVDTIFDHSGSNTIRVDGLQPGRLSAALDGDDLRLANDGRDVAVIRDYVGHEASFTGIDLGAGPQPLASLLGQGVDLLAGFLREPDQEGGAGNDILRADDSGQWLAGRGGNDTLIGGAGEDRLEGGPGNDLLRGGAGNDTYVISRGDEGRDTIDDSAGRNTAEIADYDGQKLAGFLIGKDLWVTMEDRAVLVVQSHATHPDAFAGVKAGERLVDPNELLS
jgi:Ca2+-binding RTX toxin-like protein